MANNGTKCITGEEHKFEPRYEHVHVREGSWGGWTNQDGYLFDICVWCGVKVSRDQPAASVTAGKQL